MFTGLIEDIGRILRTERHGEATLFEISPKDVPTKELELGESIAVDGVCLTVTNRSRASFQVLASHETLARTTLGKLRARSAVNLERALMASDRLGGHIVSGHVDGVGEIRAKRKTGPALEITCAAPAQILRYVVEKGSIAIDGISLTVNRVDGYSFAIVLIPHTIEKTTLAAKSAGAKVNLEVDLVGKYVEKFVKERVRL